MGKTERVISVINILAKNPATSARELAAKLQVSERSVYRYLRDLKQFGYHFNTTWDQETGVKRHTLTSLTFTAAEALAVAAACQSFLSEGLPFCHDLEEALLKIKAAINPHEEKRTFYRLQHRFTYLTQKLRDYTPWLEQIGKIRDCIRQNRMLIAVYDSHASGKRERAMDPYDLFWSEGDMYLAAYCHKNKSMRSFKVNRFGKVTKTSKTFDRDPKFNLDNYLGKSWRVYRSREEIELKILIYPPAARFFLESTFHDSQKTQKHPDGKVTCTLTTYNTPELKSFLLSWGSQVQVLQPKELRNAIKNELLAGLEKYADA